MQKAIFLETPFGSFINASTVTAVKVLPAAGVFNVVIHSTEEPEFRVYASKSREDAVNRARDYIEESGGFGTVVFMDSDESPSYWAG